MAVVACEAAYRVYLGFRLHMPPDSSTGSVDASFKAVSDTFMITDPVLGYRFRQRTADYTTVHIRDGRFDHCESEPFRADRPEISGIFDSDYASADIKIVVFDDSFTAIQWDGMTWPVLLQHRLEQQLGKRVRVANFGRFGQGALQMIDLAAATVPEWRPDFYIIAYITNDLIRPRFWLVDRTLRGRERFFITLSPNASPDPATTTDVADYYQIDRGITRQWCDRMVAAKAAGSPQADSDPLLRTLVDHTALRRENVRPLLSVNLWQPDVSFLYNRIVRGNPLIGVARETPRIGYGAIALRRLDDDAIFRQDIERLRKTGIPGIPVHLPHVWELGNGSEYWYGKAGGMTDLQGGSLRQSLEQALDAESVGLSPYLVKMRDDPPTYTISATDQHPNSSRD
jgi:hypothetical protein